MTHSRQTVFRFHSSSSGRVFPLLTVVLLCGAIVAFLFGDALASPLLYRAGDLGSGRWWTVWTAHLVHFSASHLLWDALALGGLGGWLERRVGSLRCLLLVLLAAPFVTLGTLSLEDNLLGYGGFSGLACAIVGAIVVHIWQRGGTDRTVALLLGCGLAAKITWELWHPGNALFVEAGPAAMRPVAWAHAVGGLAGVLLYWVLASLSFRRRPVDGTDSWSLPAGGMEGAGTSIVDSISTSKSRHYRRTRFRPAAYFSARSTSILRS